MRGRSTTNNDQNSLEEWQIIQTVNRRSNICISVQALPKVPEIYTGKARTQELKRPN